MLKQPPSKWHYLNIIMVFIVVMVLCLNIFSKQLDDAIGTSFLFRSSESLTIAVLAACIVLYVFHSHRLRQAVTRALVMHNEIRQTSIAAAQAIKELETYLNLAPCAWITFDANGTISHVNYKATELFGYTPAELIGESLQKIHPTYFVDTLKALKELSSEHHSSGEKVQQSDIVVYSKSGQRRYLDVALGAFEHENDKVYTCILRDITSSTLLQQQLQESQQNLLAMQENSAEQLFSVNSKHELTLFNSTFEREYEQLVGEAPKTGIVHYIRAYPTISSQWCDAFERVLNEGAYGFEAIYMVCGQQKHVQVNLRPIIRKNEHVGVSCSVNDITEQKKTQRLLQNSVERYESVTKATSEIIWDWDIQAGSMHWGQNIEKILGYTKGTEKIGTDLLASRLHEDDRTRVLAGVYSALADPNREFWTDEYRYRTADGRYVVVRDKACIVRAEDGAAVSMVGSMDDVTERRRAELVMQRFNEQLKNQVQASTAELVEALSKEKQLSELKTRFVSMVSHEFRTPLTVILSSTDLLSRYSERMNDGQKKSHYTMIQSEVNRLVTMLNEILALGRTAAGRTVINSMEVHLNSFLDSLHSRMSSVDGGDHTLLINNHWPLDQAVFDESLMTHVMTNLITNSMKYSEKGSEICVCAKAEGSNLVIDVCDHGIGIPSADVDSLFKPFHHATNVGTIQGTGLGLAITRDYVELHGGSISAHSVENVGTTITITLPQPIQLLEESVCSQQF